MSRVSAVILAAVITLLTTACSASTRTAAVPFTQDSIRVDGRLTEGAWSKAGRIASFEHYARSGDIRNQTEVLLLYDRSALYIAFKCRESNMAARKAAVTAHDGSVWDDDAVELFLDPKADGASFCQFIANTVGGKYDGLGNDCYGFNPKWDAKAHTGTDGWTLEIRIPFSELGVECPKPGDHWLGNFCRDEQPSKELSCWNPTMGGFAAPGAFGEIVFGTLRDKALEDIRRVEADLAEIGTSGQEFDEVLGNVRNCLTEARGLIPATGDLSHDGYSRTQITLGAAQNMISGIRRKLSRAAMGNPDYLVWETSPWKHYVAGESTSSIEKQTERLDVLALAGQTESRALMVSNVTEEILTARLLIDGAPVEMLLPTFVRTADGRLFPDALMPPDAIGQIVIPPAETRQIWLNFRSEKAGKYEGTLTISPLTASKRDAQVKLSVEVIAPPKEIDRPVAFTWDYLGDAEDRGLVDEYMQTMLAHGITAFWISGLRFMPRPTADDEGNLLEPMDWSRFREQVKLKWRPGRKLYITMDVWEKASERKIYNGKFDSPGWRIAFKKVVTEMAGSLADMGLTHDDYYVNPVDESIDERYVAIARLVKEADPKIKIISDSIGSSLDEVRAADAVTDHWVPHYKAFRADGTKENVAYLKSTDKPLGFYFYSEGANEKAQDSYSHYLWKLWYAYSEDLDGLMGYWTATQHYGNPWDRHETDSSYDPSLFYPGNGCVITGRRWEAWRRGLEDFALLRLCESAGIDQGAIDRAVESVLKSPADPSAASRAREALTRALGKKR